MSRTDKTRPFWVKMLDKPGNYHEVHNHAVRPLLGQNGKVVREDTGLNKWGRPTSRLVVVPYTECDLPASPWDHMDREYEHMHCHYDYTLSWVNSGDARCGCPMCNDSYGRRLSTRKDRRAGRKEARDAEREW